MVEMYGLTSTKLTFRFGLDFKEQVKKSTLSHLVFPLLLNKIAKQGQAGAYIDLKLF